MNDPFGWMSADYSATDEIGLVVAVAAWLLFCVAVKMGWLGAC